VSLTEWWSGPGRSICWRLGSEDKYLLSSLIDCNARQVLGPYNPTTEQIHQEMCQIYVCFGGGGEGYLTWSPLHRPSSQQLQMCWRGQDGRFGLGAVVVGSRGVACLAETSVGSECGGPEIDPCLPPPIPSLILLGGGKHISAYYSSAFRSEFSTHMTVVLLYSLVGEPDLNSLKLILD
jgi:hypothetical protein